MMTAAASRLTGPAGSGKTAALIAALAGALEGGVPASRIALLSPLAGAARTLLARARAAGLALHDAWHGATPAALAFAVLDAEALRSGLALELGRIDDVDAEAHFERAASSLFALEWAEFVGAEDAPSIDYEIAGLRAPERFAQGAYRLIRKLRGAGITPERLETIALRKAAEWYANPPNLAHPDLLYATPERYRDSLAVDAAELDRQRRREIDLAKVLVRTYASYLADAEERGCLTDVDAVAEATRVLRTVDGAAERARERWTHTYLDDAQDCTLGEVALLGAIFGEELRDVTLAGDPDQATRTFAGARGDRLLEGATTLPEAPDETRAAIARVAARILGHEGMPGRAQPGCVRTLRAGTQALEAAFIAREVASAIASGTPARRIAVLARSLRGVAPYVDALIARDIAVRHAGDLDLFAEHDVQDLLAMLWSIADPFRHDWLLRALQTPTLRFADATLALLCGEPAGPQVGLFGPTDDASAPRGRSDRERDLRLGRNVTRGDRDAELPELVRVRLEDFRRRRSRWRGLLESLPLEDVARVVAAEAGLLRLRDAEPPARLARRRALLERLIGYLARYAQADRTRTLADALRHSEVVAASEWPPGDETSDADETAGDDAAPVASSDAVLVASIEAVKGQTFDEVFVPNCRAGAFPPYYVPDAFLFTTAFGIVPKDNVGDAAASRTAKFTWYLAKARVRERYGDEHRRLLACAMTRAERRVTLSAAGAPTRGVGAPELLAEVDALRLPEIVRVQH